MLTRGYCIGFIIDELSEIVSKASWRSKLNLNDLSIYIEDFFLGLLNIIYNLNLENMNTSQSNYPAIDIGDKTKKIAYQISLTVDNPKITQTIEAIDSNLFVYNLFTKIYFLVVGKKQKKYSSIISNNYGINSDSVLDINDLNKEIASLDIDTLLILKNYIEKESAKVKIELEIPDETGNYQTSMFNYLENIPKENIENYIHTLGYENFDEEIDKDFKVFINKLKKLPRITREFIAIIVDYSENEKFEYVYRLDKLEKQLNYKYDSDLSIICDENFVVLEECADTNERPYYRILIKNDFLKDIKNTIKERNIISSKDYIVSLDFSK